LVNYLIIGCGHFGRQAVDKLLKKGPNSKITAVDKDEKAIQKITSFPIETIICEGISYLHKSLLRGKFFDYIIPAVPFHLAFEFIFSSLKSYGAKKGKVPLLPGLPNPMIGKTGDLLLSLSDFICPDDCPEPSQYCFITGEKRKKPLYKILEDLRGDFESRVIRSQQLGLGIGGFRLKTLLNLIEEIKKRKTSHPLILISTASRCHGVTSALYLTH
jgi:hypothetical protein